MYSIKKKYGFLRPLIICGLFLSGFTLPLLGQQKSATKDSRDFDKMDLQELLQMEVSSVSKKSESLQDAAASVYVITSEDIRRSGATRLVDVLSLVPGTFFHDNSYNYTAEAIRNGSEDYSQTILILLDGVPLTQPLTAGIYRCSRLTGSRSSKDLEAQSTAPTPTQVLSVSLPGPPRLLKDRGTAPKEAV